MGNHNGKMHTKFKQGKRRSKSMGDIHSLGTRDIHSLGDRSFSRPSDASAALVHEDIQVHTRPLPPVPSEQKTLVVRALYDFRAINGDDLSFKKGDKLEIEQKPANSDWWVAKHLKTFELGYIPSNYVVTDDNSVQSQDWWFEFDRSEAEKMLLMPGNIKGSFLIRMAQDLKTHVLSVRSVDDESGDPCVRHYRIQILDNGGFFISSKRCFFSILELVEHYSKKVDGMCCQLTTPCPRVRPVVQFRDLEVKRDGVKVHHKLGAGCFGEVWKGTLLNKVDVAVKSLKAGSMAPEDFLMEARTMHKLRHRKLVQLLAVCTQQEPIWIITELMVNGALLDYLRKDKGKLITFTVIVDMASQITDGMEFLERENFIHRDLRAANVLVGEQNTVKVADFGLARILQDDEDYNSRDFIKFPIKWTAPEGLLFRTFSTKSDVWSFGVLLYEMLTLGGMPYPGMHGNEVTAAVSVGYRMPRPVTGVRCPDALYDIMSKCWNKKPEERPTFAFLHSFFSDYTVHTERSYLVTD